MPKLLGKWETRGFGLLVFFMAVTGLAQMPIFKRYYIADIPGLGWLADFYTTHILHYAGAALLLGFLGYIAARWWREWRPAYALTASGAVRALFIALIVFTGILRVMKNMQGFHFDPVTTMLLDWSHLGLTMFLGIAALAAAFAGRRAYLAVRSERS